FLAARVFARLSEGAAMPPYTEHRVQEADHTFQFYSILWNNMNKEMKSKVCSSVDSEMSLDL
ncbi:hypothetical protein WA026_018672, partial [Henosepilachna vigintioctopunctata]